MAFKNYLILQTKAVRSFKIFGSKYPVKNAKLHFTPEHAMKAQMLSAGLALLVL
jgi:thiamine pyrophosphokinase